MAIAAATAGNPLIPAQAGELQCYSPNTEKKTCRSLATYKEDESGGYANTAVVLLSNSRAITLETITEVKLIDGAVCGKILAEDILRGTIKADGNSMPAERVASVLDQVAKAMAERSLTGHEICTRYETTSERLTAKASIDGVYHPELDQPVVWVKPTDGYTVAP